MNKRDAKKLAEAGTLTVRELRDMIAAARGKREMSRVNRMIGHGLALNIYDAALAHRDPDEKMGGMRADPYSGRLKPTRSSLTVRNILMDCAP